MAPRTPPAAPAGELTLLNPGPGLVVLEPQRAALLLELDALFTDMADELGASPVVGPPLLPAEGLARLDYFRNFPHLGVTAARFPDGAVEALASGARWRSSRFDPPATCCRRPPATACCSRCKARTSARD